jgi:hypothetical protein
VEAYNLNVKYDCKWVDNGNYKPIHFKEFRPSKMRKNLFLNTDVLITENFAKMMATALSSFHIKLKRESNIDEFCNGLLNSKK